MTLLSLGGLALIGALAPQGVALVVAGIWFAAYLGTLLGPRGVLAGVLAGLIHALFLASPLGAWGYQAGASLELPLVGLVLGLTLSLGLALALGFGLGFLLNQYGKKQRAGA